jgi:hypothetical protein
MWKRKNGLWIIPQEAPKHKSADRPHRITIALGVFSPLLAAVALYISLTSLHTSERSLEIGQRAYISLSTGALSFKQVGYVTRNEGTVFDQSLVMTLAVSIQNTGNTPATISKFSPTYELPAGWKNLDATYVGGKYRNTALPFVGPKSEVRWVFFDYFLLDSEAFERFKTSTNREHFRLHGRLHFKDVFNVTHTVDWCWASKADDPSSAVIQCGDAERWLWNK